MSLGMRAGRWLAVVLTLGSTSWSMAAGPGQTESEAQKLIREALHHEALGLVKERDALLDAAEQKAPHLNALHWAKGEVRYRDGWIKAEEYPRLAVTSDALMKYYKVRREYGDTPQRQLELAQWCDRHGLAEQCRAHLTRVIDLDENNVVARRLLGYVRSGDEWIAREDIEAAQRTIARRNASLKKWQPKLASLQRDLLGGVQIKRAAAMRKLAEIDDPEAIPAIELLCSASNEAGSIGVQILSRISLSEATEALARQAVQSPWANVRQSAAEALKDRPLHHYVPMLLSVLYTPVEIQTIVFRAPNGQLVNRQVFVREGQEEQEVLVVGTAYRRLGRPNGNGRETAGRVMEDVVLTNNSRISQTLAYNQATLELNRRIISTLQSATGQELGQEPEEWWQWWDQQNEVIRTGTKKVSTEVAFRTVTVVDQPVLPSASGSGTMSSGGGGSYECLAAGTMVWTVLGTVPIEQVQVGDLVLAQNVDTGELAYKPVLRTTVRPAAPLVRIEAGKDECIDASAGHLFWVAGEGWVKASDLKSGMQLYSRKGAMMVSAVSRTEPERTYNLIVADFNTYFCGYGKILSHDNSAREPTDALMPGLVAER